jgi:thiol-disulfide isomerase/thioredoxin
MAVTSSAMVSLGTKLPGFSLPDVTSGRMVSSDGLDPASPVLVLFIAPHCPFTRSLASAIRGLVRDYRERVNIVALGANDVSQVPEDSREGLKQLAAAVELTGRFLYDEGQGIARAFGATCTPECFLYDRDRRLVYRGQIEESRMPGRLHALFTAAHLAKEPNAPPVRTALDALLAGRPINPKQRPGM